MELMAMPAAPAVPCSMVAKVVGPTAAPGVVTLGYIAVWWVGLPWGGRAKGEACHVGAMEGGCCSSSTGDVGRWRLAHAEPCGASDWAAGMAGIYCRPGFPASWRSRAARDKAPSARPLPGTRGVWARVAQRVAGAAPPTPATLAGYHPPTLLFC